MPILVRSRLSGSVPSRGATVDVLLTKYLPLFAASWAMGLLAIADLGGVESGGARSK